MPFERYLRDDVHPTNNDLNYYYQDRRHLHDDADCRYAHGQSYLPESTNYDYHHPHAVQFQIPQFMRNGPPILAPGGGAEVLPAGLLESGSDSFAPSWFANNGFTSFHSALVSRQIASGSTASESASTPPNQTFPPTGSQHFSTFPRIAAGADLQQHPLPELRPSLEVTNAHIPDLTSSPPSTESSNTTSYPLSNPLAPHPIPPLSVNAPSTLGLPVYSASGFDVLSILSRVVSRPNPAIQLGPVDLSCSFVIVDVRRYDCPIVYASPMFCHLTGYSEQEALGRNCRFLQSPAGNIAKGEPRRFSTPEAVAYMRKSLSSSKECQTTLVNYRKGGRAFINLVTVIPLHGGVHNAPEEADEVAYHIGFQVDLTEQPTRILNKLRDGSYCVNNSSWGTSSAASGCGLPDMTYAFGQLAQAQCMTNIGSKGGRHGQMISIAVSKELRNLIADTTFTDLVSISTGTSASSGNSVPCGSTEQGGSATTPLTTFVTPSSSSISMNRMSASGSTVAGSISASLSPSLSLLLLEFLPDFLLVLSLKGAFLYVAPSVRLVLGYEPQELVGRSISDVCHPADLVPLMRELKEGSMSGLSMSGSDTGSSTGVVSNFIPKSVDLLFRALPKVSAHSRSRVARDTLVEQENVFASQSSSAPVSRSPLSSGTLCSNDSSSGTIPPYVWLECRGRLHVEPGKGRKAIILSGRARWMPVVRWSSLEKAGDVGSVRRQGEGARDGSCTTTGSRSSEASPGDAVGVRPIDPLEFWALLSSQGTFLVASASVRDVLGWGTSEVIGRSIWAMARDSRSGMRERVEAELAKLDTTEAGGIVDPPPTVVTTSLVGKELRVVPVRLVFCRTPRSREHAPPLSSSIGAASTPLIHPLNNPLCPIVCQATVLSNAEYHPIDNIVPGFVPSHAHALSRVQNQTDTEGDTDDPGSKIHSSGASLFEELEAARESSWQYELQQLKFANQRLHEELHAIEGARASTGVVAGLSSSTTETRHIATVPLGQPGSSSPAAAIPFTRQPQLPQIQSHYTPLMQSMLSASLSPLRPSNGLHEQYPPSSEWSSLAGANGQGPNPLKRSWQSEDGPTT